MQKDLVGKEEIRWPFVNIGQLCLLTVTKSNFLSDKPVLSFNSLSQIIHITFFSVN